MSGTGVLFRWGDGGMLSVGGLIRLGRTGTWMDGCYLYHARLAHSLGFCSLARACTWTHTIVHIRSDQSIAFASIPSARVVGLRTRLSIRIAFATFSSYPEFFLALARHLCTRHARLVHMFRRPCVERILRICFRPPFAHHVRRIRLSCLAHFVSRIRLVSVYAQLSPSRSLHYTTFHNLSPCFPLFCPHERRNVVTVMQYKLGQAVRSARIAPTTKVDPGQRPSWIWCLQRLANEGHA